MKIFIVGVNHKIQYVFKNSTHSTEFKDYLVGKITKHSISLIAEELSNEAIKQNKTDDSVAHVTALSADIKHRYADPDSETRESLGIPSEKQLKEKLGLGRSLNADELTRLDVANAKYHPIREEYWLSQIKDQNCSNILFLCGYNHIESFASLLRNEGHQVQVLSTN
jgi:hypothetical protein